MRLCDFVESADACEVCAVCLLKVYADGGSTKCDKMHAIYTQLHFPLMAFANTQKDSARMGFCIHISNQFRTNDSLIFLKRTISTAYSENMHFKRLIAARKDITLIRSVFATWENGLFHASGSIMRAVEVFWAGLEIHGQATRIPLSDCIGTWTQHRILHTLLWDTRPLPRSHTLAQTPQVDIHFCVLAVFAKQSFCFSSFHNPLSLNLLFVHLTHHTHTDTPSYH